MLDRYKMRVVFAVLIAVGSSVAHLRAQVAREQSMPQWQIDAGGKMEFEAASVKPDTTTLTFETLSSNVPLSAGDAFNQTGGLFQAVNHRVLDYIAFAYKLTSTQFSSLVASLPNLPKWMDSKQFDIEARAARNPTKNQYRLMMQALLAQRFKLAIHYETKQMPVFALVLGKPGKLGAHLREYPTDQTCATSFTVPNGFIKPPTIEGGFPESCGSIVDWWEEGVLHEGGRNVDLQLLANQMSYEYHGIDRPVINRTGLTGKYDFVLDFSPSNNPSGVEGSGPTFLEALREQLGLKLVSQTGLVDVVVVDHIEEPSPN